MTKFLVAASVAALLIGTSAAMAGSDGGNGPQGSTGATANAPSQPDNAVPTPTTNTNMRATTGMKSTTDMKAPMTNAGAEGNASGGAGNAAKANGK